MPNSISEAEQKRLDSLKSFQILDTLPEQEFDDLTLLASQICDTPIAVISLIDEDRQWFKSRVGVSATETPRTVAFCNHTIQGNGLFIVPDATQDSRFADNPMVLSDPQVKFYAGAPLTAPDGQNLGALCVIDRKPRELTEEQKRALGALARSVINLMKTRRELVNLKNEIVNPADDSIETETKEIKKAGNFLSVGPANQKDATFFQKYLKHYLIATLIVVVTSLFKMWIESVTQIESPFLLFACAVLLSAWRGGLGPGIYATVLTTFIIDYYFIQPIGVFDRGFGQNLRLAIYIAQGIFLTLLCVARLRGENLLYFAHKQLEMRVARRTNELAQANKVLHKEIQERTVLQEDLREARDVAVEAARLKSDFLANMSHEIRTPMNGVIGVTGLLLDTNLDAEQKRYTDIIRNSGESLLNVINDILDFSKVEAGKMEIEMLDFNLRNCIESTVELLNSKAQTQRDELAVLIYNDVPLDLCGDAGRIQQILTNLIGNAIKFTRGGDVVVRVKKVAETGQTARLRFSVSDTGEGISKEVQEKLFQPFTQSDASTTRRFGGTGLGLSISKRLVEMMNGEIGVQSEPGKGSTFWFEISLEKQKLETIQNQAKPEFAVTHQLLQGKRVLIVDDNAVNREILVYQMRSWNMEAQEAINGFEAIELLNRSAEEGKPIDLVILDWYMPGIDGLETARLMFSGNESNVNPAAIMLSSSALKIKKENLRDVGINAALNKPYRQNDLLDAIYETLNLNRRGKTPPIEIPVKIDENLSDAAIHTSIMPTKSKRILLVEDNQVNQMVAQTMLKKFGYQADVAGNGLEAIKALEVLPYDLILMDCQMPEMDGYEATRTIRARKWHASNIPIIALTAHAIDGEREKCINAGMNDYISKPVQKEDLRKKLEQWIVDDGTKTEAGEVSKVAESKVVESTKIKEVNEPTVTVVNFAALDDITGNDPVMRREVVEMYLAQTTTQLDEIERAITVNDAQTLSNVAHKTVGGSALCGMVAIVEPLRKLERLGLDGKIEEAAPYLAQARQAFVSINEQCLEILGE